MLRVGLTGGIACGKSHVLRRLGRARLPHARPRPRRARGDGAGRRGARRDRGGFGRGVLDARGALDRAALAALVFARRRGAGAAQRDRAPARARGRGAAGPRASPVEPGAVLVTDAALLIESGVHLRFDRLVVVHCAPELQLRRLRERDGLDEAAARARIEAQLLQRREARVRALRDRHLGIAWGHRDRATEALARTLGGLRGRRARLAAGRGVEASWAGSVHGPHDGPRGLSPALLLSEAGAANGLEMEALASRLVPPARGPWYRAGEEAPADAPACRLGVALAAWGDCPQGPRPGVRRGSRRRPSPGSPTPTPPRAPTRASRRSWPSSGSGRRARKRPSRRSRPRAGRWPSASGAARRAGGWRPCGPRSRVSRASPRRRERSPPRLGGDGPTAAALAGLGLEARGAAAAAWRAALEAAPLAARLVDVERGVREAQLEEVFRKEPPAGNPPGRRERRSPSRCATGRRRRPPAAAPAGRRRAGPPRSRPGPAAAAAAPAARPARATARVPAPPPTLAPCRARSRSRAAPRRTPRAAARGCRRRRRRRGWRARAARRALARTRPPSGRKPAPRRGRPRWRAPAARARPSRRTAARRPRAAGLRRIRRAAAAGTRARDPRRRTG